MEAIMKVLREKTDELKGNPPFYYKLSDRNLFNQIAENDFVNDVIELIVSHDLGIGDVNRISSWGVVNRNGSEHLVLVDYGLDMDLFNRLYRRW